MTSVTTRKMLDWSNFTGIPDAAHLAQLLADGWVGVILGTQFPATTRLQYAACRTAGMPVEALYVFVYWDEDDIRRVSDARSLAIEFGLQVWLDCEWGKTGYPGTGTWAPDAATLVGLIAAYKAQLGMLYAGIYTGRWWWVPFTGDSHAFATDRLWHADYSPPDFAGFVAYGGWLRPVIIQYSSGGTAGINADLDVEEVWTVPTPIAGPTPDAMRNALITLNYWIYRGWDPTTIRGEDRDALRAALGLVPA